MKLSVKGMGFAVAIIWAAWVGWAVLMMLLGVGSVPYDFMNHMYLNLILPSYLGIAIGVGIALVDGFIAGAIFAWIYNRFVK